MQRCNFRVSYFDGTRPDGQKIVMSKPMATEDEARSLMKSMAQIGTYGETVLVWDEIAEETSAPSA